MSMRIASSGSTRTMQQANISHLFRVARLWRRSSCGDAAKGLAVRAGVSLILRVRSFLHAFDDDVRGDVDPAGDHEKHDAEDEKDAVVIVAVDRLAHLRGDRGGHGADGIGE